MNANPLILPPALPKWHALVDYGHGLYKGFCLHTQDLADGCQYEVRDGQTTNPQPYPARNDLRFVWTPYV